MFTANSATVQYAHANGLDRSTRARRPTRAPRDPADAGDGARRDRLDCRWHWRQRHGVLVAAGICVSAFAWRGESLADPSRRAARGSRLVPWRVVAGIWRSPKAAARFPGSLCVPHGAVQSGRGGPDRATVRPVGVRQLLRRARPHAGARPVPATRRGEQTWRGAGRRDLVRVLAVTFCRRGERDWTDAARERSAADDRWRHA